MRHCRQVGERRRQGEGISELELFVTFWSVKGGSGVSVAAAGMASLLSRRPGGCVMADLGGDQPAVMGLAEPVGPGLLDWCDSGAPAGALGSLTVEVAEGLHLLPRGEGPRKVSNARCRDLAAALAELAAHVVVDSGEPLAVPPGFADPLAHLGAVAAGDPLSSVGSGAVPGPGAGPGSVAGAGVDIAVALRDEGRSLFVTRPCYLALRRARRIGVDADGVVVVSEPGRAISSGDVAELLGLPVLGVINVDETVARSVDAGTLVRRTPALLCDGLRHAG